MLQNKSPVIPLHSWTIIPNSWTARIPNNDKILTNTKVAIAYPVLSHKKQNEPATIPIAFGIESKREMMMNNDII